MVLKGSSAHSTVDRDIARLAIPALATLLAEPLYVLTDTAIVGHLGTDQLAGLALASTVLLTGYAIFVFLAYGTTAAVARLAGAGRRTEAADTGVQAVWLASTLGCVMMIVGLVWGHRALEVLGGSGHVLTEGWIYLRTSLFGVPALMVGLAGTGYLRGLQNMHVPLVITVSGVAANLVIEVVLIFGVGFGIGASAVASVVAQWGTALVFLVFIARDVGRLSIPVRPAWTGMVHQLRIGADLLVRTVSLRASLLVSTFVAAGMGASVLAAHQIVFEIWNFLAMVLDSLAIAAQALIGRMLGEGNRGDSILVGRRLLWWATIIGAVALVVVVATSPVLGHLFSNDPDVLHWTISLLVVAGLCQPVNSLAFTLDGILIGAGDTRFLAVSMAVASAVFVGLALTVRGLHGGILWLWGALGVLMAIRAVLLGLRFRSGSWVRVGPI